MRAPTIVLGIVASGVLAAGCDDLKWVVSELTEPVPELSPAAVVGNGPAAAPEGVPVIGSPGVDKDGFPLATPDPRALLSLLRQEDYGELTRVMAACQAAFEADFHYEAWTRAAVGTFDFARDIDEPLFDRWLQAQPSSFAPWAARGAYQVSRGSHARGSRLASETSKERFRRMGELHAAGRRDLYKALELNPRAIGVHRKIIQARRAETAIVHALSFCPSCDQIRVTFLALSTPRWGGSYRAMTAVSDEAARHPDNPRLLALAGMADWDRCTIPVDGEPNQEKLEADRKEACERSVAGTGNSVTLLGRGRQRYFDEKYEEAIVDLRSAVGRDALDTTARRFLAWALARTGDAAAATEMEFVNALVPDHPKRAEWNEHAVEILLFQAQTAWGKRDLNTATRLFDAIRRLDPDHAEATKWAKVARKYGATSGTDDVVSEGPSFEQTKAQAEALAKDEDAAGALALWETYNKAHATNGPGWFESARAAYVAGDIEAARTRADRACELRHEEACLQAKRLKDLKGETRRAKRKNKRKKRRSKRRAR